MWLGAHIGIAAGLAEAPATGRRIGCDAIQIFSKSPQMWKGPPIPPEAAAGFAEAVRREGLRATAVHHGYLINLASPKKPMLAMSRRTFVDELERAERLGVDALIFHPGAHLGSGVDEGLRTLVASLNEAFEKTAGFKVRALLENAAGQGTAMCSNLAELRRALDGVESKDRVGVAIDTCHLFAAGVDFRTPSLYGEWMDRLDAELGRREVRAFHLNDAKAPLGSHLDRHENIGKGEIGSAGFQQIVSDPRWDAIPGYLETPLDDNDYARYIADLSVLRGLTSPASAPTPASRPAARPRRAAKSGTG
ncbi:MAG TPA: deoxyribonuclease IV [Thermoplasmata archaeon]|nr:deoxyribonuclease IV [Thermoplasmata archaeon]